MRPIRSDEDEIEDRGKSVVEKPRSGGKSVTRQDNSIRRIQSAVRRRQSRRRTRELLRELREEEDYQRILQQAIDASIEARSNEIESERALRELQESEYNEGLARTCLYNDMLGQYKEHSEIVVETGVSRRNANKR